MASRTILRVVSGVDDVRAAINNSTLRRRLTIGTAWNKIRVGIRANFTDTGAPITGTPMLFLGMCSGVDNPWNNAAATTTHAVGIRFTATSMTYTAAVDPVPAYYTLGVSSAVFGKRIGTVITTGSSSHGGVTRYNAHPDFSWVAFVDLTKGSPNFSQFCKLPQVNGGNITRAVFMREIATGGVFVGHSNGSTRTQAVSEATNGYLDTFNVSWDKADPVLEISDIAVVRLA